MNRHDLETKILVGAALALAFALTLASASPAQRHRHNDDLPFAAPPQVTQKTFTAGSAPQITVDNITGPIQVVGDGGSEVRLTATETVSGRSQEAVAEGQREVHLDVTQDGDHLSFYVDGPFRCGGEDATSRCGHWGWHWHNPGYQARFAFELHVPVGAKLDLKTINDGDIAVTNVDGDFQVNNINGGIDLEGMAGSGRAYALNGPVKAAFHSNPAGDSYFGSLNGDVSLYFQSGLSADLKYKTFNGNVYTDFAVAPLPAAAPTAESRDGMRVFRSGRFGSGQVGHGGPVITLDGFNGNVYVHEVK